ncbi:hypothetical protein GCM10022381_18680 [Leifsonia kafniensis]|uniref:HTH luxR-type domain-containing protein n=1 Tax=Leifsonia kafniensis TaxID=475957 RepID=A0ABP7KI47_9MICO
MIDESHQYREHLMRAVARHESRGSARRREIAQIETFLAAGTGVVLAALPGLGKNFVAERIAGSLSALGHDVTIAQCNRPPDLRILREPSPPHSERRAVLIVEDAHLLGLEDLQALVEVATDPARIVLVTLDTHPGDCARDNTLQTQRLLTLLWTDYGLERIDLSGVGFEESKAIIHEVSGTPGLDVALRARIVDDAAGNPLLLRELTREVMNPSSRYGRERTIPALGPTSISPRILDLTRPQLADLSAAEEYALITVAKLGTLPYVRAARLVGQAPLRTLIRRGLVAQDAHAPEAISASIFYATAAMGGQTTENPFETAHTAELLILADYRQGHRMTAAECVLVAAFWAANPQIDPLVELEASAAACLLARAARLANIWDLPTYARVFAEHSRTLAPNVLAMLQISRSLAAQGRRDDALQVLENDQLPHTDAQEDEDVLAWWMTLLAWCSPPNDVALERVFAQARRWGTIDSVLDDWRLLQRSAARLSSCDAELRVTALKRLAANQKSSPATRLRAVTQLLPIYAYAGRATELTQAIHNGRALMVALSRPRSGQRKQHGHDACASFIALAGISRAQIGIDRSLLAADLDAYALRAVCSGNATELAFVNLVSGYLALDSNEPARALANFDRAAERLYRMAPPIWTTWARLLRSHALAAEGRVHEAVAQAGQVSPAEISMSPLLNFCFAQFNIWIKFFCGDAAAARADSLSLAASDHERSRLLTLRVLHGALAVGESAHRVVMLLNSLPVTHPDEHTDLLATLEEHLRAEAAGDGFRLDAVGFSFRKLALVWEASFAFRGAQAAHLARGRPLEAAASTAQADAIDAAAIVSGAIWNPRSSAGERSTATTAAGAAGDARIAHAAGGAGTDAGAAAGGAGGTGGDSHSVLDKRMLLTRREREVAQLAGKGMSNSEIAGRLFISVRTVESHVLQARVKLGAVRRSDLGIHLADSQSSSGVIANSRSETDSLLREIA